MFNKNKSIKENMRDEIEDIIKSQNIDRARFHEFDKRRYNEIIKKFYYAFFDYEKFKTISLNYLWLNVRGDIELQIIQCSLSCDWEEYISKIKEYFCDDDKTYYLILSQGWVYEGYISEIQKVLYETTTLLVDFYIVSKKFDKAICHCDDGECLSMMCFKNK